MHLVTFDTKGHVCSAVARAACIHLLLGVASMLFEDGGMSTVDSLDM